MATKAAESLKKAASKTTPAAKKAAPKKLFATTKKAGLIKSAAKKAPSAKATNTAEKVKVVKVGRPTLSVKETLLKVAAQTPSTKPITPTPIPELPRGPSVKTDQGAPWDKPQAPERLPIGTPSAPVSHVLGMRTSPRLPTMTASKPLSKPDIKPLSTTTRLRHL